MTLMGSFDLQYSVILPLICLLSALFLLFFSFKKPNKGFELPPSPPSLPIIGHTHLLLSLFAPIHLCFHKISSKYGPFLHLRIFHVPVVLVSSASVAYEIFKDHDMDVSFRGVVAIDECVLMGSSSFVRAPYGDYWKFMKKLMVTKMFGPRALEQSRGIRATELECFHRNLLDKATKMQKFDIGEEVRRFVTNTLGKLMMGSSFSEGEKVSELVKELDNLSQRFFVAQVFHKPLEKLGISLLKKKIMKVSHRFEELLEEFMVKREEKLDEHHGKPCMDTWLASYEDKDAEYKITRNQIKALAVELFFGAGDTSSQTVEWAMVEMINNPKILERLREEIDDEVGKTRLIQETDLPKLPYLQAVVKEALRLHPPMPVFPREFTQGCKIGGFYIPKGTSLAINAYAVMRDPEYWEDPNEFKPERFLGQEEEKRQKAWKYLPFGAGRRACLGSNLGYSLSEAATGMMVQCFNWETGGRKINTEEASGLRFLSAMAHPPKCTLVPRDINPNQDFDEGVKPIGP